jgi:hypothetical protein
MDASAVRFDDRARDREAEATAPGVSRAASIDSVKPFEDPLELLGRDTRAGIADCDLEPAAPVVCRDADAVPGVGMGNRAAPVASADRSRDIRDVRHVDRTPDRSSVDQSADRSADRLDG